jgi:hypothetical protein
MTNPDNIEPSFALAIEAITTSTELSKQTKGQWCSGLRGLARCFSLPCDSVPARFSAVRARMLALRCPPFDWTPKRSPTSRAMPRQPCSGSGARPGSAKMACL